MIAAAPVQEAAGSGAPEAISPAPSPSVGVEKPGKLGGAGALRGEVELLRIEVAELKAQVAARHDLNGTIEAQGQMIAELRGQLGRLAASMGRSDILTTPATVDQLRAAHAAGNMLLVLRDLAIAGPPAVRFTAGAKIEARQYALDRLIELVEGGKLHVAVVR